MIVVVGLSHHTAGIEVREKVALSSEAAEELACRLGEHEAVAELFIVSTCNRVEIVAVSAQENAESVDACIAVCQSAVLERCAEAAPCLYVHQDKDAVRHVIRVAASLDSLVVGEAQIMGQLKQGFERSRQNDKVGPVLHQLFVSATRGAKRVRSETSIGVGQVSVPSIAVDLASQIFDNLRGRHAVLIGSGEMGQTVARLLSDAGAQLTVVGRSLERVTRVADRVGGEARLMADLPEVLVNADIVVSSTSATTHVLTESELGPRRRSRKARNLFIIDLAVPRDVCPEVGRLDATFLYDVDDLSQVARESSESRQKEADAAQIILDQVLADWERRISARQIAPTIKALRAKMRMGVEAELQKSLRGRLRDLDSEQRAALAKMLDSSIARILHDPVTRLRLEAARPDADESSTADEMTAALTELFELENVELDDLNVPSVRVPPHSNSQAPATGASSLTSESASAMDVKLKSLKLS